MTETRDFPTEVMASLSSGVPLCEFGAMHEAAEYLMGHPIWTHHFADKTLTGEMKRAIAEQCPGMPTDLDGVDKTNWQAKRDELACNNGSLPEESQMDRSEITPDRLRWFAGISGPYTGRIRSALTMAADKIETLTAEHAGIIEFLGKQANHAR
jgi:hypothetical protein